MGEAIEDFREGSLGETDSSSGDPVQVSPAEEADKDQGQLLKTRSDGVPSTSATERPGQTDTSAGP